MGGKRQRRRGGGGGGRICVRHPMAAFLTRCCAPRTRHAWGPHPLSSVTDTLLIGNCCSCCGLKGSLFLLCVAFICCHSCCRCKLFCLVVLPLNCLHRCCICSRSGSGVDVCLILFPFCFRLLVLSCCLLLLFCYPSSFRFLGRLDRCCFIFLLLSCCGSNHFVSLCIMSAHVSSVSFKIDCRQIHAHGI